MESSVNNATTAGASDHNPAAAAAEARMQPLDVKAGVPGKRPRNAVKSQNESESAASAAINKGDENANLIERERSEEQHGTVVGDASTEDIRKGIEALSGFEKAPWIEKPKWWFDADLKYSQETSTDEASIVDKCSYLLCPKRQTESTEVGSAAEKAGAADCGEQVKLLKCARCQSRYCSRECQVASWKRYHKRECPLISAWGGSSVSATLEQKHAVLEDIFRRVRMYMNPYAVGLAADRGPGFVLMRSNATLGDWVYEESVDNRGQDLERFVRLQFLTLGEFDALAFEDDFEMAQARPSLLEALDAYDQEKHVVILSLLRCGTFTLVTLPLVPEHRICISLAQMYKYTELEGPLQLCVDERD